MSYLFYIIISIINIVIMTNNTININNNTNIIKYSLY